MSVFYIIGVTLVSKRSMAGFKKSCPLTLRRCFWQDLEFQNGFRKMDALHVWYQFPSLACWPIQVETDGFFQVLWIFLNLGTIIFAKRMGIFSSLSVVTYLCMNEVYTAWSYSNFQTPKPSWYCHELMMIDMIGTVDGHHLGNDFRKLKKNTRVNSWDVYFFLLLIVCSLPTISILFGTGFCPSIIS